MSRCDRRGARLAGEHRGDSLRSVRSEYGPAGRLGLSAVQRQKDSPPDPAFDKLLPTLRRRATAPIMLPAELPSELKNVAVDDGFRGQGYNIMFLPRSSESNAKRQGRAEAIGGLTARPGTESHSSKNFEAASSETVELPDGTEATLRYLKPKTGKGARGSYWEGKFYEHGTTYHLFILSEEVSEDSVKRTLSSMVLVPQKGGASGKATLQKQGKTSARR